jgi:ATF/CREB family transcription factor
MPAPDITKSPPSVTSPPSDVDPKPRPPPRPTRSNFDLEPNPFERSFANDSSVRTQHNSPAASTSDAPDGKPHSRPGSADKAASTVTTTTTTPPDSHKTILPPLAAIASPNDAHYSWAFSSSSFSNSLRSGPLSPAMLTGPQQQSDQPLAAFDPAAFRTGLTPRMGLTPGTGLTPLLGGPVSFPPASPNTAAFLSSVMNTSGTPSLSSVAGTITPNTLNAITGVLASQQHTHAQSPLSMSTVTSGFPPRSDAAASAPSANGSYNASANNAAQTATNGLFLLSQAHQELTKREEEAAAALSGSVATVGLNGHVNGSAKRGTKRKSYDTEGPVVSVTAPTPTVVQQQQQQAPANGKRTRSSTLSTNGRRASTVSLELNEEEEDDDEELLMAMSSGQNQSGGKKSGSKKLETEEEKRKNFLERNRQGKLSCIHHIEFL